MPTKGDKETRRQETRQSRNGSFRLFSLTTVSCLLLLISACNPDRCKTPFGEGGTIDVTMPDYSPLSHVGGAMSIGGIGRKGVHVTRTSYSEFVAFEMTCPNDHDVRLQADAEWGNSILTCPTCGSRFNALDGMPFDGSATPCPLYQYSTAFDGRVLSIYQ